MHKIPRRKSRTFSPPRVSLNEMPVTVEEPGVLDAPLFSHGDCLSCGGGGGDGKCGARGDACGDGEYCCCHGCDTDCDCGYGCGTSSLGQYPPCDAGLTCCPDGTCRVNCSTSNGGCGSGPECEPGQTCCNLGNGDYVCAWECPNIFNDSCPCYDGSSSPCENGLPPPCWPQHGRWVDCCCFGGCGSAYGYTGFHMFATMYHGCWDYGCWQLLDSYPGYGTGVGSPCVCRKVDYWYPEWPRDEPPPCPPNCPPPGPPEGLVSLIIQNSLSIDEGLGKFLTDGNFGKPFDLEVAKEIIQINTPGGLNTPVGGGTDASTSMDASKISAKTREILKRDFGFGEIDKRGNQL